jgi:hypothetical protein
MCTGWQRILLRRSCGGTCWVHNVRPWAHASERNFMFERAKQKPSDPMVSFKIIFVCHNVILYLHTMVPRPLSASSTILITIAMIIRARTIITTYHLLPILYIIVYRVFYFRTLVFPACLMFFFSFFLFEQKLYS